MFTQSNLTLNAPVDFHKVDSPDLHQRRRKEMLIKYPEIKKLMGYDDKTKYLALLLFLLLLILAFYTQNLGRLPWLLVLYVVGATLSHALCTAIHEVTHHLAFKRPWANRAFAIFINLPLGIPMAMTFEKYHAAHHRHLGHHSQDVDIPLSREAKLFKGYLGKIAWLMIQPFTYTLRPFIKNPMQLSHWDRANIIIQLLFNFVIIYFVSWTVFFFLIGSALLGMSLHPIAAHSITEHFVVGKKHQETYSYYGPMNYLMFNVGYHVEHHDFPSISWSKLKKLKQIAPEFYTNLHCYPSWFTALGRFIFSKKINLFIRIVRDHQKEGQL